MMIRYKFIWLPVSDAGSFLSERDFLFVITTGNRNPATQVPFFNFNGDIDFSSVHQPKGQHNLVDYFDSEGASGIGIVKWLGVLQVLR